jgi:hypothetical protein
MKKSSDKTYPPKYRIIFDRVDASDASTQDILAVGVVSSEIEEMRRLVLGVEDPGYNFGLLGGREMCPSFEVQFSSNRKRVRA